MQGEKHDLISEFPGFREKIHTLKTTDRHFARLFNEYDRIVHEIHRMEEGIETPDDSHLESLKKQRLHLKDQLYAMLARTSEA